MRTSPRKSTIVVDSKSEFPIREHPLGGLLDDGARSEDGHVAPPYFFGATLPASIADGGVPASAAPMSIPGIGSACAS